MMWWVLQFDCPSVHVADRLCPNCQVYGFYDADSGATRANERTVSDLSLIHI